MRHAIPAALLLLTLANASIAAVQPQAASEGQGAVALRVLPNAARAGAFFKNWGGVGLVRTAADGTGQGEPLWLAVNLDASSVTGFFAGTLPPGHYRLSELSSVACSWGACKSVSLRMPDSTKAGFEVKAGQLTDLGVVVQSAAPTAEQGVLSFGAAPDAATTAELVRELTPGLAPYLAQPLLAWDGVAATGGAVKLGDDARVASYGVVSPVGLGERILYATRNGVVVAWTPAGPRQYFDVGQRSALTGMLARGERDWITCGEFGLVERSVDGGETWRSLRGNLPFGLVVGVAAWHEQVVATVLRANSVDVEVLADPDAASPRWTSLARYTLQSPHFWDVPGVLPETFVAGDKVITSLPGKQVGVYDAAARAVAVRDLPGSIDWFAASADGVLRFRAVAQILGVRGYESRDDGKSWDSISAMATMQVPAFRDAAHGVGFKGGFARLMGKISDGRFVTTEDGGKTWVEVSKVTSILRRFLFTAGGKVVYALTDTGELWGSVDAGRTWAAVQ